jgi:hypothetical protein
MTRTIYSIRNEKSVLISYAAYFDKAAAEASLEKRKVSAEAEQYTTAKVFIQEMDMDKVEGYLKTTYAELAVYAEQNFSFNDSEFKARYSYGYYGKDWMVELTAVDPVFNGEWPVKINLDGSIVSYSLWSNGGKNEEDVAVTLKYYKLASDILNPEFRQMVSEKMTANKSAYENAWTVYHFYEDILDGQKKEDDVKVKALKDIEDKKRRVELEAVGKVWTDTIRRKVNGEYKDVPGSCRLVVKKVTDKTILFDRIVIYRENDGTIKTYSSSEMRVKKSDLVYKNTDYVPLNYIIGTQAVDTVDADYSNVVEY